MRWIDVATEDAPSIAVARRLIAEMPGFNIGNALGGTGNGYLRKRISSFHQMAFTRPILILTDLDSSACPFSLITDWMGSLARPPGMLFRVVVRAIESWLLADHDAVTLLLGPRASRALPPHPDELADPKSTLVRLAKRAPRDISLDICPAPGSRAKRGINYNNRLTNFVATQWDPGRAAARSPSLHRARARLAALAATN